MITVTAHSIENVLKIWITFLDESKEPNRHITYLFGQNIKVGDLCRQLLPLVEKFQQ